jgi:hypothetical protein
MKLDSRYALVTGTWYGVGRAIALASADKGYTVTIHNLKQQDAAWQVLAEVWERGADGFIFSGAMTPGGRYLPYDNAYPGGVQLWVSMGTAKAAMETLVRYPGNACSHRTRHPSITAAELVIARCFRAESDEN